MSEPVYIVEDMAAIVAKVNTALTAASFGRAVYYMFGHPLEIVTRLQQLSQSTTQKDKKYPLVALFTDIPVVHKPGFYGEAKMNIIIATLTKPEFTAPQRLQNNFKPILQPIKDELLNQIDRYTGFTHEGELSYTEIERYYWGKQGLYGNNANVFNDYIDCIELQNVTVTLKLNNLCPTN